MRILTWNINSVRLRAPLLAKLSEANQPDIIALQETKTPDDKFPFDAVRAMGCEHIHIHGMKGYNGVAILSKTPFDSTDIHHHCGKEDCRHISVRINGFDLHNLYIPAGGDEPDITQAKFKHKLGFVEEMTEWFSTAYDTDAPLVVLGDFNIAPFENDVWSHKQLLKVVSHTPQETTRLKAMRESLDWIDCTRAFISEEEKAYTWWSYRNRNYKKSNRGRRLDHIWVTQPLKSALSGHGIFVKARDWEKPSDHVPVWIDLDL